MAEFKIATIPTRTQFLKFVLIAVGLMVSCRIGYAADLALTVESKAYQVTPQLNSVNSSHDDFKVACKVCNTSTHKVEYWVWNCALGASWQIDNASFGFPSYACMRNVPERIVLEPRGCNEKVIPIVVKKQIPSGPADFKIGLKPAFHDPAMKREKGDDTDPIWSNLVGIYIENK